MWNELEKSSNQEFEGARVGTRSYSTLHRSLIVKSQQNIIELVTRPGFPQGPPVSRTGRQPGIRRRRLSHPDSGQWPQERQAARWLPDNLWLRDGKNETQPAHHGCHRRFAGIAINCVESSRYLHVLYRVNWLTLTLNCSVSTVLTTLCSPWPGVWGYKWLTATQTSRGLHWTKHQIELRSMSTLTRHTFTSPYYISGWIHADFGLKMR